VRHISMGMVSYATALRRNIICLFSRAAGTT